MPSRNVFILFVLLVALSFPGLENRALASSTNRKLLAPGFPGFPGMPSRTIAPGYPELGFPFFPYYPGSTFPGNNYPGPYFPGNNYPGPYPGTTYPGNNYPGPYPGTTYPGNNYPYPGATGNNNPGMQSENPTDGPEETNGN